MSTSSSPKGWTVSNCSSISLSGASPGRASSKSTSAFLVVFCLVGLRLFSQKIFSRHDSRFSASYRKGSTLVSTRRQFSACLSGARSGYGKARRCRSSKSREVSLRRRVSMFARDLSRARRMSVGEKREKTSSTDSGSSQN